jgi:hypothetical protein
MKKRLPEKHADRKQYKFKAEVWLYKAAAAWHFITLPKDVSEQIKFFAAAPGRGWGSVRVKVTIGATSWDTSIFPDSKSGCYLLPLKADVRKKENIREGKTSSVTLVTAE